MIAGARRRLGTLVRDPRSVAWRYRRLLTQAVARPVRQRWAARRLARLGVLDDLRAFVARRPAEAIPPDFEDLLRLYQLVLEHGSASIVEYGSGCSTLVLAHAARRVRADWSVYSVDADPFWADSTRDALPPEIAARCTVAYVPVEDDERHGLPGVHHAALPPLDPELVYLDGPPLPEGRPRAFDLLDLERRADRPFVLIVDGRPANAEFLEQHLQRRYRVTARARPLQYVFEPLP